MARAKKENMKCFYETSFDTAVIQFFDLNPEKFGPEIIANSGKYKKIGMGGNTSVKISPVDPDKTLWKVCLKKEFNVLENDIFMWNQILENEYVMMYELRQKMGGTLVEIKTDCVVCEVDDAEATLARFDLDETIIGGLKEALPTLVSSEILPQENNVQTLPNGTPDYSTVEEKDFEDFPAMVEHILKKNQSTCISGRGGTGKTTLIKMLVEQMECEGLKVQILAPTNVAAKMFENGMTIHKFLGINNKHEDQAKMHTKMAGYDWIIVDETGMVGYSLWKHFQHAKLNSTRCKFIFAGDHYQLPPVKEDMDGLGEIIDYHNSYVKKFMCDFNLLLLTENKRSDSIMWDLAERAHDHGIVNPADFGNFDVWADARLHICFTNAKRVDINQKVMEQKVCTAITYRRQNLFIESHIDDLVKNPFAQDVHLIHGAPVMCVNPRKANINKKTDKEDSETIYNCQTFTVKRWCETLQTITLEDNVFGEEYKIPIQEFHQYFVVAYCVTTHKSQSQTFDFKYAIHEIKRMSNKMKYTALTRTTKNTNIVIVNEKDDLKRRRVYEKSFLAKKLSGYRAQDKKKSRIFDLTIPFLEDLVVKEKNTCFICSDKLDKDIFTVDRVNNELGHLQTNVRLACFRCNCRRINYE